MIGRAAMLGMPAIAIAVTAAVLLGPGATRPALAARVYGAPAPAPSRVALRVVTLTSLYGVEEAVGIEDLAVERGGEKLWAGASSALGVAEAAFAARSRVEEIAVVSRHRVLARGPLELARAHPTEVDRDAWLEGPTRGELKVRVASPGGAFAASFPAPVVVEVQDGAGAWIEAEIKATAPGARVEEAPSSGAGKKTFTITPQFHVVTLEVDATAGTATGHWEGNLPIVPGAMAIEGSAKAARVVSQAERERAYLSFWNPNGRFAGAVVPLVKQADGSAASAPLDPTLWSRETVAITVSGDPLEQGVGTVTWPVERGRYAPPELTLLLDGVPRAITDESARAWRVRRWGLLVLGAAALAEICLVLARSRRAQAELEAHFDAHGEGGIEGARRATETPAGYWALASASLIAGAFAIVAALAAFR